MLIYYSLRIQRVYMLSLGPRITLSLNCVENVWVPTWLLTVGLPHGALKSNERVTSLTLYWALTPIHVRLCCRIDVKILI